MIDNNKSSSRFYWQGEGLKDKNHASRGFYIVQVFLEGKLSNQVITDLLEFVQVMKNNKTRLQHFFE